MKRIFVYPKDVQMLTGKSERHCREIIKQIRLRNKKEKHQLITVSELCEYLGVHPDSVRLS